ncbi:hypothetical protein E8E14_011588 [Neopestalotiopsis sp. 37M]|nr:hypothetical protein E8E14_011588 [Neopestalotiopsis sp. 37M]
MRRGWRITWIMAVFGCVLVLKFVLYNDDFLVSPQYGRPMKCLWQELPKSYTGEKLAYVIFGVFVDVSSAYAILFILYPELKKQQPFKFIEETAGQLVRQPTALYKQVHKRADGSSHSNVRWLWQLLEWPTWYLCLVAFTLCEIFTSLYWDMLRIFLYLFTSSWLISQARNKAVDNGEKGQEDSWGFGQILPMLLLALPLLSFVEAFLNRPRREFSPASIANLIRKIPLHGLRSETELEALEGKIWKYEWFGICH